ncbi:MAG: hypothetical protein ACR2NL_04415 [Acidimicrobiia bacterium]
MHDRDRAAFQEALGRMDIELSGLAFERAFTRVSDLVETTGKVTSTQVRAIADEVSADIEALSGVVASFQ